MTDGWRWGRYLSLFGHTITDATASWLRANDLYRYFYKSQYSSGVVYLTKGANVSSVANSVKPGDIIGFNLLDKVPIGIIDHVGIVTEVKNGEIYYSAHSNPKRNFPLSSVFSNYNGNVVFVNIRY